VAIAELGESVAPAAVVEIWISPDRSLIRPIIEIPPLETGRNQAERCCGGRIVAGAGKITERLDAGTVAERKISAADRIETDGLAVWFAICGSGGWNCYRRPTQRTADGLAIRARPEIGDVFTTDYDLIATGRDVCAAWEIEVERLDKSQRKGGI